MYSVQPTHLWKYLSWQTKPLPPDTSRLFYLSWEDAVWSLIHNLNIPRQSTVLVPEFFCGDVENNIRARGYTVAYYPVSANLETTPQQLIDAIQQYSPSVLIVFHAVGITNTLWKNTFWIKTLPDNTLLIEDSVHRIVDPTQLVFLKPNHVAIDSLRKVVPLQGSCVYGRKEDLVFTVPRVRQSWLYATQVTAFWLIMEFLWSSTHSLSPSRVSIQLARAAERAMLAGYDLIGDSPTPAAGWPIFSWLQRHLDIEKIERCKKSQVRVYESMLGAEQLSSVIGHTLPYNPSDQGKLRQWPVLLNPQHAQVFLERLRARGLIVRFELNDSQWSKQHKIIYLPLGPYLTHRQICHICLLVKAAAKDTLVSFAAK